MFVGSDVIGVTTRRCSGSTAPRFPGMLPGYVSSQNRCSPLLEALLPTGRFLPDTRWERHFVQVWGQVNRRRMSDKGPGGVKTQLGRASAQ